MSARASRLMVLVASLALVAAACGEEEPVTQGSPSPTASFTTKVSGTITIGSDIPYAPFEFKDASGKLVGFDVELMEAVAAKISRSLEWKDANFDTIFTSLAAGKFDIVASSVTAYAPDGSPAFADVTSRRKIVGFSVPYYSALQSLTVNTKETPNVATIDDLKSGDKVAVQSGTTGQSFAKQTLEAKGVELVKFPKAPTMFEALDAGRVVGVVNDLPVSQDAVKNKPDLKVVQQLETGEQYGIAVQKENPGLLAAIDGALQGLFKDGTYAAIFKKYFPDQELPAYASQ